MPAEPRPPVQWLDQVAVATVPVEIDISNVDGVLDDLLSVVQQGPAALVVDMSQTTFCDSSGVNALVRVRQQALAAGAPLRLVIAQPAVQRVLAITGVGRLIGTFPTVAAALADEAVSAAREHAAGARASGAEGRAAEGRAAEGYAAEGCAAEGRAAEGYAAEGRADPQPGPKETGGQTTPGGAQHPVPESSLD
jgi:anti-sigma B factor antagonist